jgi:RNA polymerase primary sigma factor
MTASGLSPGGASRRRGSDPISWYLSTIGRVPLLTPAEEIELGNQVQAMMRLTEEEPESGYTDKQKKTIRVGRRSKERMMKANLRLVVSVAKKYQGKGLELLDLIQEGSLGLERAVEKFDPTRGYKFSTYAYWWIREGITRAIAAKSRTVRLPVHVGETLSKLRRAQHTLWHELGRAPRLDELADHTGLKELDIRETLFRAQQPLSLDSAPSEDDASLLDRIACSGEEPGEGLTRTHMRHDIQDLLKHLPADQAELLRLRYGINAESPMPLSAVARNMGVTRDTARGIERRAINNVKELSERVIDYLEA